MTPEQARQLSKGDLVAWKANDGKLRRVVIDTIGRFGRTASVWREGQIPGSTVSDRVNTSDLERKLP